MCLSLLNEVILIIDINNNYSPKLPVPRLRGRLGQVRCRKASWGCFGGRHLLEFFVALCFGRCGQM